MPSTVHGVVFDFLFWKVHKYRAEPNLVRRSPFHQSIFGRRIMQVYNVVRFKVKQGEESAFLDAHRDGKAKWPGLEHGVIIKTGEQTFCLIGTWSSQDAMVAARSAMIKTLDSFRSVLEDQGNGRGVTDAVSGAVVLDL
jgi:hypothetical protein